MSDIEEQDGDKPILKYQAGGLGFESTTTPNDMLTGAFVRAKQSIGQRAFMAAVNREESKRAAAIQKMEDAADPGPEKSAEQLSEEALAKAQALGKSIAAGEALAQAEAQAAAEGVVDPFEMEPCAMAVFMFLSRELEYRDLVIEQLNDRLISLGAQPLDVEHPHPTTWTDTSPAEPEEASAPEPEAPTAPDA